MQREVTQTEFFERLYADPRDIMPRKLDPHRTTWETSSREVFGVSYPGWLHPEGPKQYFLTEAN